MVEARSDILNLLRSKTAELHQSLANYSYEEQIRSKQLRLPEYIDFLSKNYLLHLLFEGQFEKYQHDLEDFNNSLSPFIRSEFLMSDLQGLGEEPDSSLSQELRLNYRNIYEFIGGLYVIEGSMLGAGMIYKTLSSFLDIEKDSMIYLSQCYQLSRSRWLSFNQLLKSNSFPNAEKDAIVFGAIHTFELAHLVFRT